MKNILPLLSGCILAALSAASATTYNGNGASGFNGSLGNGVLTITNSGGNVNFSLDTKGAGLGGNVVAFYIDSVTSGIDRTTSFTDDGTTTNNGNLDNSRAALSGYSSFNDGRGAYRTTAVFPFKADFGIALDSSGTGFAGLFQLQGGNTLTFLNNGNLSVANNIYSFSLPATALGLTADVGSFGFIASLISSTAYRANETIGTSATTASTVNGANSAPNAGFNGTQTFSAFNTYTLVPEPGTVACFGLGALALGGAAARRMRRARQA